MFRHGATYTRRQVHDAVGGDLQSYLPHVDGRVVAACLRLDTNPDAPAVILAGRGAWIERSADLLVAERTAVPTFIKRGTDRWEYVGDYVAVRQSRAADEIADHARRSGRRDISCVIHMAKADSPDSSPR
jgi:hypothetical protein